ncbi:Uncharacterised protein [Mycobacteroides abscessus subsp. abscessus]|nr:Uncharacterised protein [Mycobacteroides abscessus subsp. abscessus]
MNTYFCPVCWRRAHRTPNGNIFAHFDSANNVCPGGEKPFTIVITAPNGNTLRHTIKQIHELREAIAA